MADLDADAIVLAVYEARQDGESTAIVQRALAQAHAAGRVEGLRQAVRAGELAWDEEIDRNSGKLPASAIMAALRSLLAPTPSAGQPSGDAPARPSMGYLSTLADMETVVVRAVGIFERAARGLVIPGQPIDQRRLAEDCESALRQLRPMLLTVRAFLDANDPEPSGDAKVEGLRAALHELVRLKDGPRDAEYERRKSAAWAAARLALSEG